MKKSALCFILLSLCIFCFPQQVENNVEWLIQEADSLSCEYGEESELYLDALSRIVSVSTRNGDIQTALRFRKKHCNIIRTKFGQESLEFADDLLRVGNLYNYYLDKQCNTALHFYKQAYNILESLENSSSAFYEIWYELNLSIADAYFSLKQYHRSVDFYMKALSCSNVEKEDRSYPLNGLALSYLALGRYSFAEQYAKEAISYLESKGIASQSSTYLAVKTTLARSHDRMSYQSMALNEYQEILNTLEETGGYNVEMYIEVCIHLIPLYSFTGNSNGAIALGEKACRIAQSALEQNSFYTVLAQKALARALIAAGRVGEAINYLLPALEVTHTNAEEWGSVYYLEILSDLLMLINNGVFDADLESKMQLEEHIVCSIFELIEKNQGQLSYDESRVILHPLLSWLLLTNQLSKAKDIVTSFIDYCKNNDLGGSEDLFALYRDYADINLAQNIKDNDLGVALFDCYKQIITELLYYPEEEKQFAFERYNIKDVLFSLRDSDEYNGVLYDFLLLHKGFLLKSNLSLKDYVDLYPNPDFSKQFYEIRSLKRQLKEESAKPISERSSNLNELRESISHKERLFLKQIRSINEYSVLWRFDIDWKSVAAALEKSEIAIEFVNYIDPTEKEEYYAALLLRAGWTVPCYVPLCKITDIEDLIKNNPQRIYGDCVIGQQLYSYLWKPLEKYIEKGESVYYSPSGIIHKLNLSALYINATVTVGDRYRLIRRSSTSSIVTGLNDSIGKDAGVWGGLEYDSFKINEKLLEDSITLYSVNHSIIPADSIRRGKVFLPGTLIESQSIADHLTRKKITVHLFQGREGDEGSFKSFSGNSPSILHIATHGFFLPKSKAKRDDYYAFLHYDNLTERWLSSSNELDEAMLRSGLIMSGGNIVYDGNHTSVDTQDGILTALEIAELNLSKTDLVVLSACETGLGDISDEGVIGLQRAFKNAGAKTIVMSLWQVSDDATLMLMESFYKSLLKGNTKYDSFCKAVSTVRRFKGKRIINGQNQMVDYSSPFYWAAFILLD